MARTVAQINTQIVNTLTEQFGIVGIVVDSTKWSKRNMLRLLCFVFASCTAYVEQLMDTLKLSIETTASHAAAANALWIQTKMFQFQYSVTNPQIIKLTDMIPAYPVIDPTLQIITGCSVTSTTPNEVVVKVAKTVNDLFVKLDPATELPSAQGYINLIGTAGINYMVVSLDAAKLYIQADIYYQGQYGSGIKDSVIAALVDFLHNVSVNNFDGSLKITDLENAIRSVAGVNDVVLITVLCREDTESFGNGLDLILDKKTIRRLWHPLAGYVVPETTLNQTLEDSLNFIAE